MTNRKFCTVALVAALAIGGCAQRGSTRVTAAPMPPEPSTTTSAPAVVFPSSSTSTRPESPTPTTATLSPTTTDRCHTFQLAATDDGPNVAVGTVYGRIVFRNISAHRCTLYGYIGLQRLDAHRQPMTTNVMRDRASIPSLVLLDPQQQASAGYRYCNVCSPPAQLIAPCPAAPLVEVTPPDEEDFIVVRSAMAPCDAAGSIRVTSIQAGKTGPSDR